ncbi:MAG: hypothetical protein MAG795_00513 [Candidatus Woesearchaeota archaeon]|nr:hypothetical protein [Candidatus Woesearchaeota archaeon]
MEDKYDVIDSDLGNRLYNQGGLEENLGQYHIEPWIFTFMAAETATDPKMKQIMYLTTALTIGNMKEEHNELSTTYNQLEQYCLEQSGYDLN